MYPVDENPSGPTFTPALDAAGYPILSGAPAPLPRKNSFFLGRFGLRAGYGMAIFIVVFLVLSVLAGIASVATTGQLKGIIAAQKQAKLHPEAPKPHVNLPFSPKLIVVQDGVEFAGMALMCWLFAKGERRRFAVYGIGSHRWTDVFGGAFWGLVAMSGLVFVLHAMHVLVFDSRALYGSAVYLYGAKWLLAFFFVGCAEEYSFRGYLQFTLTRGVWGLAERISAVNTRAVAFWIAATSLSLLFTLAHTGNKGETAIGLLQVFLAGMTLAYGLWRTGSLWWSIGMHMTWDWAQSFLYGVADSGNISVGRLFVTHPAGNPILSGGPDGPEGSLIGVGALAFLCLIIRFTTKPGAQPALEQEPIHEADTVHHAAIA